MATAVKRTNMVEASTAPQPRASLRTVSDDDSRTPAAESPARTLQAQLAVNFPDHDPADKWSARRTLGFLTLTCGGFWAGVIVLVKLIVH